MSQRRRTRRPAQAQPTVLRIIGGQLGGRKLTYSGEHFTRPMKERVREAIFNLISTDSQGRHAVDLFAGTGALGLEAISRGSPGATFLERHFPSAGLIRRNAAELGVAEQCEVVAADTFAWWRKQTTPPGGGRPLLAFCSPPYDFYTERTDDMLELIEGVYRAAPAGSIVVVESDARFDHGQLPPADSIDTRRYAPAVVSVMRKG